MCEEGQKRESELAVGEKEIQVRCIHSQHIKRKGCQRRRLKRRSKSCVPAYPLKWTGILSHGGSKGKETRSLLRHQGCPAPPPLWKSSWDYSADKMVHSREKQIKERKNKIKQRERSSYSGTVSEDWGFFRSRPQPQKVPKKFHEKSSGQMDFQYWKEGLNPSLQILPRIIQTVSKGSVRPCGQSGYFPELDGRYIFLPLVATVALFRQQHHLLKKSSNQSISWGSFFFYSP